MIWQNCRMIDTSFSQQKRGSGFPSSPLSETRSHSTTRHRTELTLHLNPIKTMKRRKTLVALLLAGLSAVAVCAVAIPSSSPAPVSEPTAEQAAELRAKLDRAANDVRDRLHMPAMLEISDDPAEEAEIAELYRSGWITEATVEEVEAALKAAAATTTLEDDVAARILAHRASCRYFLKE